MKIIFSDDFRHRLNKIKEDKVYDLIISAIKELETQPNKGKPLLYSFKNHRSLRVSKFRVIYRIENDVIFVVCFDERKNVYKKLTKYIN